MKRDDVLKLVRQRPFKPFRITTSGVESIDIVKQGMVLVGETDINIGLPHPERPFPAVRNVIWLGLADIVRAEELRSAPAA